MTVDNPPAEDILERLAKWLTLAGLTSPASCSGLDENDLKWSEVADLGERTFCRRAVRGAMEAEAIKAEVARAEKMAKAVSAIGQMPGGSQLALSNGPSLLSSDMAEVMGADASAMAIAQALQHGGKQVDTVSKLKAAGAGGLGFHLQVDTPVWQLLNSESEAAKIEGRTAFSYVDLTSKAMLPVWMPADAVGGKFSGSLDWQSSADTPSAIQSLERALKAATMTPKFFRSLVSFPGIR